MTVRNKSWDNQCLLIDFTETEFREREAVSLRGGKGGKEDDQKSAVMPHLEVISEVMNHVL